MMNVSLSAHYNYSRKDTRWIFKNIRTKRYEKYEKCGYRESTTEQEETTRLDGKKRDNLKITIL